MTINTTLIEEAMERYTEAEFNLYSIQEAKKEEMKPIETKYRKPLKKAENALDKALIQQHKAIAETIKNNPDWYTDPTLYKLAVEGSWTENNRPFFFDHNECYIDNAITSTSLFSNRLLNSETHYYVTGHYENKARIVSVEIMLDASTSDEELEELAKLLEPYMDALRYYTAQETNYTENQAQASIFEHTLSEYGSYSIVTEEKGEYNIAKSVYGSCRPSGNTAPLLDVLKTVRKEHWFSDKKHVHEKSKY